MNAQSFPAFPVSADLAALADVLKDAGGRAILVGGAVRDHILGTSNKDIDIEVFGLSLDDTEKVLRDFGSVHEVGRSFGVFKVTRDDETYDVALPRTESKTGTGHRGFAIQNDPNMSFADAAQRRDFTINAMGIDLHTLEILDPTGGMEDLKQGVLRHVSEKFDEDPLRVLRACQFAARLAFTIHPNTLQRCLKLNAELSSLPSERLYEELRKLLVKARFPSIGLSALIHTGALSLFPELHALRGCIQEAEWHPEGDVWVHTLMVVDAAAMISRRDGLDEDETFRVVLGALCHDLGKPATLVFEEGRYRTRNHEAMGEAPTRAFLEKLGAPHALTDEVVALVVDHLKPFQLYGERAVLGDGAIRRLALRVPIPRLVRVSEADFLGRTTPQALEGKDPSRDWLLERAEILRVKDDKPEPLLLGRHLIERGQKPGAHFKRILDAGFAAQLDGAFDALDQALLWLDDNIDSLLREVSP